MAINFPEDLELRDEPDADADRLDDGHIRRSPKSVELPPSLAVLREARRLAGDRNVRISRLADCISQDPVLTLEILRLANATFYSGDRPSIATIQTAVVRLGSQNILGALEKAAERPPIAHPDAAREFETLIVLSTQVSTAAYMLASALHRDISDIAQTTGLMVYMGHLISCVYLQEDYCELLSTRKRNSVVYAIQQEFGFDPQTVMLEYLRNHGLPQTLFFGLDRDLKCKSPTQSGLRFTVAAAQEMVEAFGTPRWEKYYPGRALPSGSAFRLLKMTDQQYVDIYDAIESYLKRATAAPAGGGGEEQEGDANGEPHENGAGSVERAAGNEQMLELDIAESLLAHAGIAEVSDPEPPPKKKRPVREPAPQPRARARREREPDRGTLVLTARGFSGYDPAAAPTNFLEVQDDQEVEEKTLSEDAQKFLNFVRDLCEQAESSQDLLVNLLKMLIIHGPFVRAALIVLRSDRQMADIHTAVGDGFEDGETITVKDPLSPLALCLTKIKSFNVANFEDQLSPFGISSYAISPLKLQSALPVVLYADCGLDRPLALEARKIFRLVVGLINQALPRLGGELPKKAVRKPGDTSIFSLDDI